MFMGEYHLTLDDKGRVMLPAKIRSEMGDSFVITRGPDRNLIIYTEDEWNKKTQFLEELSDNLPNNRRIKRFFYAGARRDILDKQGRILIPLPLRAHAGLEKEVVLIGISNYLEIWAKEQWEKMDFEINNSIDSLLEGVKSGL